MPRRRSVRAWLTVCLVWLLTCCLWCGNDADGGTSSLVTPVAAWDCLGHMLVAEVARRHLRPDVARKANRLVAQFARSGPFAQSPDLVQAACWADDVRGWHLAAMSTWHYIDTPYRVNDSVHTTTRNNSNSSSSSDDDDDVVTTVSDVNVVTMTRKLVSTLRAAGAASSRSPPPPYILQLALVYIVHLVGDAHQPLHAITAVSHAHPRGDRGGNDVHVHVDTHRVSLHALWDSLCQRTPSTLSRPLSDTSRDALRRLADYLEYHYPPAPAARVFPGMTAIARESYALAVNTSYAGVVDEAAVSLRYLRRCAHTAEARLVLAGYRLADLLNTLLEHIDVDGNDDATGHVEASMNECAFVDGKPVPCCLTPAQVAVLFPQGLAGLRRVDGSVAMRYSNAAVASSSGGVTASSWGSGLLQTPRHRDSGAAALLVLPNADGVVYLEAGQHYTLHPWPGNTNMSNNNNNNNNSCSRATGTYSQRNGSGSGLYRVSDVGVTSNHSPYAAHERVSARLSHHDVGGCNDGVYAASPVTVYTATSLDMCGAVPYTTRDHDDYARGSIGGSSGAAVAAADDGGRHYDYDTQHNNSHHHHHHRDHHCYDGGVVVAVPTLPCMRSQAESQMAPPPMPTAMTTSAAPAAASHDAQLLASPPSPSVIHHTPPQPLPPRHYSLHAASGSRADAMRGTDDARMPSEVALSGHTTEHDRSDDDDEHDGDAQQQQQRAQTRPCSRHGVWGDDKDDGRGIAASSPVVATAAAATSDVRGSNKSCGDGHDRGTATVHCVLTTPHALYREDKDHNVAAVPPSSSSTLLAGTDAAAHSGDDGGMARMTTQSNGNGSAAAAAAVAAVNGNNNNGRMDVHVAPLAAATNNSAEALSSVSFLLKQVAVSANGNSNSSCNNNNNNDSSHPQHHHGNDSHDDDDDDDSRQPGDKGYHRGDVVYAPLLLAADARACEQAVDMQSGPPQTTLPPCRQWKLIKDCVYEHVQLPMMAIHVIDTPEFQRLRTLKQLGTTLYLYPGATHTRFEHCIGVAHLASQMVNHIAARQPELRITAADVLCVTIAGLCHDLGHGPFSHLFEQVVEHIQHHAADDEDDMYEDDDDNDDDDDDDDDEVASMCSVSSGADDEDDDNVVSASSGSDDDNDGSHHGRGGADVARSVTCPQPPPSSQQQQQHGCKVERDDADNEEEEMTCVAAPPVRGRGARTRRPIACCRCRHHHRHDGRRGHDRRPLLPQPQRLRRRRRWQWREQRRSCAPHTPPARTRLTPRSDAAALSSSWRHETMSIRLLRRILARMRLADYGLNAADARFIELCITGLSPQSPWPHDVGRPEHKRFLVDVVANKRHGIDVDKLDYFLRDSHGVYGRAVVDVNFPRLLSACHVLPLDGQFQICFEEKMALSLCDIFALRAKLHKHVYQHRIVKVIDNMMLDVLVAADAHVRVRGSGGVLRRISECVDDEDAFCRLGDWIVDAIAASNARGLRRAQRLLDRLRRRALYAIAGSATFSRIKPGYSEEKMKDELIDLIMLDVEDEHEQHAQQDGEDEEEERHDMDRGGGGGKSRHRHGVTLHNGGSGGGGGGSHVSTAVSRAARRRRQLEAAIIVAFTTITYGSSDSAGRPHDPINDVTFYNPKRMELGAFRLPRNRVSPLFCPSEYSEQSVLVMVRIDRLVGVVARGFDAWKGRNQAYLMVGVPSFNTGLSPHRRNKSASVPPATLLQQQQQQQQQQQYGHKRPRTETPSSSSVASTAALHYAAATAAATSSQQQQQQQHLLLSSLSSSLSQQQQQQMTQATSYGSDERINTTATTTHNNSNKDNNVMRSRGAYTHDAVQLLQQPLSSTSTSLLHASSRTRLRIPQLPASLRSTTQPPLPSSQQQQQLQRRQLATTPSAPLSSHSSRRGAAH